MSKLVIVESPAKAKTIKKYLGSGYDVVASMGHVRDLPPTRLSVNVRKNFEPVYEIISGKEKTVEGLVERAKKDNGVILATDPDREGEAISWHLAYILGLSLEDSNRVTFNEITKNGIKEGMKHPRPIDMNLVNAQQARRILDRLVGYKLSPFVSQRIRRGLSAGRVQSVAMRLIVDREEEIVKFVPEEYWTIDAKFNTKSSRRLFAASFYGDEKGKIKIPSKEDAEKILEYLDDKEYIVSKVKKGKRKKSPSPPFITSTLQQEASRKLGFQAKRTMKVAQELYEGIETEKFGAIGLITYMRTDSLRISDDAINEVIGYIKERWGDKFLPPKPRVFKSKANAQDAHEAIRPTMPSLHPDDIKKDLSSDQYKLYKLIWERFVACQMADCIQNTTQIDISAGKYIFKASGYTIAFEGFTILYIEGTDSNSEEKENIFPELEVGMKLNLKEIKANQHFTQPPAKYTEASLIKTLEENGIGRPSTYAVIISNIVGREYVIKDGKSLQPTELGIAITNLIKKYFPSIVNAKFTAKMEDELDVVAEGKCKWVEVLKNFYGDFYKTLKEAREKTRDLKIDLGEEPTDIICEKCGRQMVIKHGRYGKFIACPGFPECSNTKKIKNETGAICPKCGGSLVVKKSKKGRIFYGCDNYPNCDFMSWNEPLKELCPKCSKTLFKRKGKSNKKYCITEGCNYESE